MSKLNNFLSVSTIIQKHSPQNKLSTNKCEAREINSYLFIFSVISAVTVSNLAMAAMHYLPEYQNKWGGFNSSAIEFVSHSEADNNLYGCMSKGFNLTSCGEGLTPDGFCEHSKLYFKVCLTSAQICLKAGFVKSCKNGYIKDSALICTKNPDYGTCIVNPCEGYDFTLSEATAPGYIMGGKCLSGEVEKFQRLEADCAGFRFDSSNCGAGSKCEELGGLTCRTGNFLKYSECKACPPPVPTCNYPQVKVEDYWCGGGLRCWIPGSA